jgi:serine/threonine protein kinase
MGVVYRAHDRLTGEDVALKQVQTPLHQLSFQSQSEAEELHLALTSEFQTLASLHHPHIIQCARLWFL